LIFLTFIDGFNTFLFLEILDEDDIAFKVVTIFLGVLELDGFDRLDVDEDDVDFVPLEDLEDRDVFEWECFEDLDRCLGALLFIDLALCFLANL